MKLGPYIVVCLAAVILDATLGPEIEILGARPDFAVLVVIYGALLFGGRTPIVSGFLMGVVADAELPHYLGLNALALAITGFLAARLLDHLVKTSIFVQCTVIAGATLLHDAVYYIVYYRNHLDLFGHFFLHEALLGAAYTAALGAVVYAVVRASNWRTVTSGSRW
ncbi:rod shape-determining protein MreD [bacterium]|nr:rod shape-determining protein MreD [bacterium]